MISPRLDSDDADSRLSPERLRAGIERMLLRSRTDMPFRRLLLTEPRRALEQYGYTLPEDVYVEFIENRHTATIVLPPIAPDESRLRDADLDRVDGGTHGFWYLILDDRAHPPERGG